MHLRDFSFLLPESHWALYFIQIFNLSLNSLARGSLLECPSVYSKTRETELFKRQTN